MHGSPADATVVQRWLRSLPAKSASTGRVSLHSSNNCLRYWLPYNSWCWRRALPSQPGYSSYYFQFGSNTRQEFWGSAQDESAVSSITSSHPLFRTKPDSFSSSARMLTKGTSARIQVHLRPPNVGAVRRAEIPLETFAVNKSMGRVLFRRGGETIAAGIVTSLSNN